jgi:long-chain acyl-CoA synthetase
MIRNSIAELVPDFLRREREIAYVFKRGYRMVRWTYGDVARVAFQFARELEERGISKGDRVLLWGENCAEWVAAFWGCTLRGVVAVPLDRISSPEFARRVTDQVDAKLLLGSTDALAAIPHLSGLKLETLRNDLVRHSSASYSPLAVTRNDIAEIIFTSGTTAEPRGVVLAHGNILANLTPLETEIAKYIKYERIFHPIRFLNLLPLSHVFGQFLGLFVPQLIGGTVLFQETLNPSEIVQTIKSERVSVTVTVPRVIETIKDKIERDLAAQGKRDRFLSQFAAAADEKFVSRWWRFRKIHNLFGWKFWAFISGGAALDAQTEEFWRRLSFVVIQGYGLTESTSLISVNHPFKLGRKSIGKVLPGREMKLDESGEILVRGENIAQAYWQGKQLVPVAGDEGWFRTGDLGAIDSEGNLYFKGRKKNVIVTSAGMNVYPADLEEALRHQPEIRDAVVVGLARGGNSEPCGVLILRNGNAEEAVKRANEKLAEYQRMRCWLVWPESDFPRTSTQKPRTNLIQQWAETQAKSSSNGLQMPEGGLGDLISRITKRSATALNPGARLEDDLNLSSLDRVELMSAIEDRYGVDLDEGEVTQSTTIEQLERMLQSRAGERTQYVYPRWGQSRPIHWLRALIYYLMTWPATMILAKPEIRGREHLRGVKGPLLIVANHITETDIGFIQAALPARLRTNLAVAMQGEMLNSMRNPPREWNPIRRWWEQLQYFLVVALFNVFPLPQRSGFRQSFAYAGESVDRGYSVVVFPEGRRTTTGELSPFRTGIGLLYERLNLPVLPVHIDGLYELKLKNKKWAAPGAVRVTIGTPIRFDPTISPEAVTRELQNEIAALKSFVPSQRLS